MIGDDDDVADSYKAYNTVMLSGTLLIKHFLTENFQKAQSKSFQHVATEALAKSKAREREIFVIIKTYSNTLKDDENEIWMMICFYFIEKHL